MANVDKVLSQLYAERDLLNYAIAQLEQLQHGPAEARMRGRKRGRKMMSPEERMEVSERMRRYWAQRKG